jgi:hypothetical protein
MMGRQSGDQAKAIDYMLRRLDVFTPFSKTVASACNAAERASITSSARTIKVD